MVEALDAHTRKTLRGLGLTSFSDTGDAFIDKIKGLWFLNDEPFIGSLSAFEVSKTIRLETMMLYKGIEGAKKKWMSREDLLGEPERLVDVLPVSTNQLSLVGELSDEDATAMLEDLPALKEEQLTNLSGIFFEDVQRHEIEGDAIRESAKILIST